MYRGRDCHILLNKEESVLEIHDGCAGGGGTKVEREKIRFGIVLIQYSYKLLHVPEKIVHKHIFMKEVFSFLSPNPPPR